MTRYGYFLSSEESGPHELVEHARLAEQAGFEGLWISDHFHPWNDEQGESPFVWSVIGALAEAVRLPVETAVTCPTVRLHPAVVAQAAATSAALLDGRFRLGIGTGEALNEQILGDAWPPAGVRLEMLEEAVHVMRALFTGKETNHHGKHYTVENARLYTLPEQPVPLDVSAFGPRSVEIAARIGDGLITMAPDEKVISRFHAAASEASQGADGSEGSERSGPSGRPVSGGLKVCWDTDREEAVRTVHRLWPNQFLPGELGQVLRTPRHFEQAAQLVTEETVSSSAVCGNDADEHVRALRAFADAGCDWVYVNQIGPNRLGFFDFYRNEVLPRLNG
ncbi:TIGR03557 family F420-dependent LLM class oxidoreductase [Streptomyces iconiensis]|uniref:TIGR03557 family F420-dependent LLM class oxidoreductase n=1 Tax=Streptomyces iconiensis TaxID=1384038 RepID=A0ABT6ZT04_9ACTN|nr:TIGR03557 family F420-dependent LLM class oxidoreductase [Streptomyces iconiensis]MDJ1132197.1 TIGR03557 family F420-dependent LLM class oxidoreductase [Streptomyces iconiensis]